jgi:exodeoxyribonuclease V alpha subunit
VFLKPIERMKKMKTYTGRVKNFLFRNDESNFAAAVFILFDNEKKSLVISGMIGSMKDGAIYEVTGETIVDSVKGRTTFKVEKFVQHISNSSDYLIKYLSSPTFPTIGKMLAKQIVELYKNKFKGNVLENISKNPETLMEAGASKSQAEIILDVIENISVRDEIENRFNENGLNLKFLSVLFREVADEEHRKFILENDFYNFANKFSLAPFEDVDAIALHFGVEEFSDLRISWIAWSIVSDLLSSEGGTFTDYRKLKAKLVLRFGNEIDLLEKLKYAKKEKILVFKDKENTKVYTGDSYEDESFIASKILDYSKEYYFAKLPNDIDEKINLIQTKVGTQLGIPNFSYNIEQKDALQNFVLNSFQIITGGPGTGKTTVILGLLELAKNIYKMNDQDIAVVAPTGRAASRISEATGFNAITIHRLLRFSGGRSFSVTDDKPIYKRILIIDESSMIDQFLFAKLLRGVKGLEKVILVGDPDQLPSVGFGNVFEDLIRSDSFCVDKLIINNRQKDSKASEIIDLANAINNGTIDNFDFEKCKYLKIFTDENPTENINKIVNLHPIKNSIKHITDLQLITSMNKGDFGVVSLNELVQKQFFFDDEKSYKRAPYVFHVSDKVICIENNAEKQIYNGDMGIIEEIKFKKNSFESANVRFGDRLVQLSNVDFAAIKLAYACTVHKTQGSEFKNVVIVIDESKTVNNFMINKKLLYTAVTRAKEGLYIFSSIDNFKHLAKRKMTDRLTTLKEKIKALKEGNKL